MDGDPATPPAVPSTSGQRLARIALATAVVAVGLWILREFLAALAWAAVLAIAFWPLYRRFPPPLSTQRTPEPARLPARSRRRVIFFVPAVPVSVCSFRLSQFRS